MFECQVEVLRRDGVGVRRMVCDFRFGYPFSFLEFCFSVLSPLGGRVHPLKTKVCWESCFGFAKTVADFGKAVSDCEKLRSIFQKKKGELICFKSF